jgi:LytS/YehU family sensor histidine kinase
MWWFSKVSNDIRKHETLIHNLEHNLQKEINDRRENFSDVLVLQAEEVNRILDYLGLERCRIPERYELRPKAQDNQPAEADR